MKNQSKKITISLEGLTCPACERKVHHAISALPGVQHTAVSYTACTAAVTFLPDQIDITQIYDAIRRAGYEVQTQQQARAARNDLLLIIFIIGGLFVLIQNTIGFNFFPQITAGMSYGMLFLVGLLTSLHCVAMCGGIALSQCTSCQGGGPYAQLRPGLLYNLGRVVSYTLLGGVVGFVGSVFSITPFLKALIYLVAGIFMVLMALNMLGQFSLLRRITPRLPAGLANLAQGSGERKPFVVGLLNGLMPCGPLQSMQLYALATGGFFSGALSMFLFSIGTVPLMLGFTSISALVSKGLQKQVMRVSAVVILMMGFAMGGRGLSVAGIDPAAGVLSVVGLAQADNMHAVKAKMNGSYQTVSFDLEPGEYREIIVQKGVPVRWSINAGEGSLNGCNNEILVPAYGIEQKLSLGENLIEFTPQEAGSVVYTCWMGMITSKITVI